MTATVVTSENLAEFHAHKLDIASAPASAEAEKSEPVVDAPPSDAPESVDVDQADPQDEQESKKAPGNKVEKRFSELTKQREDARRDAEAHRIAREASETENRELKSRLNPPAKAVSDAEPQPGQFSDAFEYAKALSHHAAEQALANRDRQDAEKKGIAERAKVVDQWNKRQETVKGEVEDYADVIATSTVSVSDQVRDAILESDAGPRILYHLAKNPDIAQALTEKSVSSALREIGKLEAQLSASTPAKPVVTPSKASPPISPIRGTKSVDSPVGSDGEYHGSYADWKAQRRSGKIK